VKNLQAMNINIPSMREFKMWYIEKYGQPDEDHTWSYLYTMYIDEYLNDTE